MSTSFTVDREMILRTGLRKAIAALNEGRIDDSKQTCSGLYRSWPNQPDLLNLLGAIACAEGNEAGGADYFRRAVGADGRIAAYRVNLARTLATLADYAGSMREFRAALALDAANEDARAGFVDVLLLSAVDAMNHGSHAAAIGYLDELLGLAPDHATALVNRGNAQSRLGRNDAALADYASAARLAPSLPEAHLNACVVLHRQGADAEAVAAGIRAVELAPWLGDAHFVLGVALEATGRGSDAIAAYRAAIEADPAHAMACTNLAAMLRDEGDAAAAERWCRRALELQPGQPEALLNLGNILQGRRIWDQAIECFSRALAARPDYGQASHNLSFALFQTGRYDEAEAYAQQAMALLPELPEARWCRAMIAHDRGRPEEAAALLGALLADAPDHFPTAQGLAFVVNSIEGLDPARVLAEHRRQSAVLRSRLRDVATPAAVRADGGRLRIGYLSPDLRNHSVARFFEPILAHHDRSRVEVFCYRLNIHADEVTTRLANMAEHWRDVSSDDDERIADRIRGDGIDILVDLAGNTGSSRPAVLMQRPAPVQVFYLGYPTSLGMHEVGYRISDWQVDPQGYEAYNSERLLRLPASYFCFQAEQAAEPGPPPSERNGCITFGSFNALTKIGAATVALWSRVLRALPDSRLFLKTRALGDAATAGALLQRLADSGIDPSRVRTAGHVAETEHLALYGEIDIGLDTWPYNGATTTCQAMWMGVPVVSLAGATHASRTGLSILRAAGIDELATTTEDEFVARCLELAASPERLRALRGSLRARMSASPLMAAQGLTAALEDLYRQAWSESAPSALRSV